MRDALRSRLAWPLMVVVLVVAVAGCAPRRPVLYPDAHFQEVGAAAAERDVAECRALAAARSSGGSGDVARKTVVGGGTGAAAGAVGGAIYGDAGRGAAAGAAAGVTAGLLQAILGGSGSTDVYRNFVSACLGDRGYRVIGWE